MGKIVWRLRDSFKFSDLMGIHACNGLVAIALVIHRDDGRSTRFFVYNLTTGQHSRIPPAYSSNWTGPVQEYKNFAALNIAYDPLQYDHYRLVYVWVDDSDDLEELYDSETGYWRDAKCGLDCGYDDVYWKGILWNGDLFWVCRRWNIVCVDIETARQKCSVCPFPCPDNILSPTQKK
ncbi:OLC1v1035875C1 [Oldenlandia corymbosa var. corymbosa]|uniref:OLC1v1035875C1 n=1 Tax=Oldenlandia corymbosa var. corymbosa TaxID=529605 RepID=A0AAV1CU19_OLDCO|nr:OLC1v1035875C1 [Oldenlandia corymbosa var. corymbosa]